MKIAQVNNILFYGNINSSNKKDTSHNNASATNVADSSVKTNSVFNYKKQIAISTSAILLLLGICMRKRIINAFRRNNLPNISANNVQPQTPEITKPEYLFHMTSLENYNSMLKDGVIKKSNPMLGNGVFLSNISDLKNKYDNATFASMLNWYSGNNFFPSNSPSKTVVLLKIPVKDIDSNILNWRQIQLINSPTVSQEWLPFLNFTDENIKALHEKPLEYLYRSEIPMNIVKKYAEVNVGEMSKENVDNFVREFWNRVFRADNTSMIK